MCVDFARKGGFLWDLQVIGSCVMMAHVQDCDRALAGGLRKTIEMSRGSCW